MSLRKVNFVPGEYYHIYNRGNSKQKIFNDEKDYEHFIHLLYLSNTTRNVTVRDISREKFTFDRETLLVNIGAYCLMPNHFHLLINESVEGGVSKFMQKLTTAYVMYYNKKYNRTGSLFEGKFKSQHAGYDIYLKYLFSYIHLNPIKLIDNNWKEDGIKNKKVTLEYLSKYKYSSYFDYMGVDRLQNKILNTESFPKYFPTHESFKNEIFDWIKFTP